MSGNRSLDEFGGAGAGEGSEEEGAGGQPAGAAGAEEASEANEEVAETNEGAPEADDVEAEAAAEPASTESGADVDAERAAGFEETDGDDATPEPPASTYVWSPDGGACEACGATVEERWRDGEALVCAGCKEW